MPRLETLGRTPGATLIDLRIRKAIRFPPRVNSLQTGRANRRSAANPVCAARRHELRVAISRAAVETEEARVVVHAFTVRTHGPQEPDCSTSSKRSA
jgi:hypothetical protein